MRGRQHPLIGHPVQVPLVDRHGAAQCRAGTTLLHTIPPAACQPQPQLGDSPLCTVSPSSPGPSLRPSTPHGSCVVPTGKSRRCSQASFLRALLLIVTLKLQPMSCLWARGWGRRTGLPGPVPPLPACLFLAFMSTSLKYLAPHLPPAGDAHHTPKNWREEGPVLTPKRCKEASHKIGPCSVCVQGHQGRGWDKPADLLWVNSLGHVPGATVSGTQGRNGSLSLPWEVPRNGL